jgi:hypothetical protein
MKISHPQVSAKGPVLLKVFGIGPGKFHRRGILASRGLRACPCRADVSPLIAQALPFSATRTFSTLCATPSGRPIALRSSGDSPAPRRHLAAARLPLGRVLRASIAIIRLCSVDGPG